MELRSGTSSPWNSDGLVGGNLIDSGGTKSRNSLGHSFGWCGSGNETTIEKGFGSDLRGEFKPKSSPCTVLSKKDSTWSGIALDE